MQIIHNERLDSYYKHVIGYPIWDVWSSGAGVPMLRISRVTPLPSPPPGPRSVLLLRLPAMVVLEPAAAEAAGSEPSASSGRGLGQDLRLTWRSIGSIGDSAAASSWFIDLELRGAGSSSRGGRNGSDLFGRCSRLTFSLVL